MHSESAKTVPEGQYFVPDPNAYTRRFADGRELSRAEMSFRIPGPFCVERDAGWLPLAIVPGGSVVVNQELMDRLNILRQRNVQHGPHSKHAEFADSRDIRIEFFTLFGWFGLDNSLGELLSNAAKPGKWLPSIDKVLSCARTSYAYTGSRFMEPIYESPRLLFRPEGSLAMELEGVAANGYDPSTALLLRPGFFGKKNAKDIASFSLSVRGVADWVEHERRKVRRRQWHEIRSDPSFTPDPSATTKCFPDGLELSPAEMSYHIPGALSLERDAGWLRRATFMRDVTVDQEYIDYLNAIRQKSLMPGQGKSAWPEFREALGWSGLSKNNRLLFLVTVIHNMRLMYFHLGNMVMAPVTNNMVKVLERAPATFIKELDALGDPAIVQDTLIHRTNLFSYNLLALLEKNGGTLPERGKRGRPASNARPSSSGRTGAS